MFMCVYSISFFPLASQKQKIEMHVFNGECLVETLLQASDGLIGRQ